MNPVLDEVQVALVEHKLTKLGLDYLPLKSEYLDHICCQIETKLSTGQTFEQAIYVVFEAITKDELKELQQQTILFTNQKSRRMKNLMFVFTCSVVLTTGGLFFLKGEKNIAPVQLPSPEMMAENSGASFLSGKNIKICKEDFFTKRNPENQAVSSEGLFPEVCHRKSFLLETPGAGGKMTHLFGPSYSDDPPEISPLSKDFKVAAEFGMRMHPKFKEKKFHKGVDFVAPPGTPVLATANGIIFRTKKNESGYGHHIIIRHDEQFSTLYAHLQEIMVSEGQAIQKGAVIGTVGSSGASTNPHLHYEVIKEGQRVNPMAYCKP